MCEITTAMTASQRCQEDMRKWGARKPSSRHGFWHLVNVRWMEDLTEYVQDPHTGTCETFLREIKEDLSQWRAIYAHGLEDSILLKCQFYKNGSKYLMLSQSKLQWILFVLLLEEINELISILKWKCKEPDIAKIALKREVKVEG